MKSKLNAEEQRIKEQSQGFVPPWQKWGPYVSERSWGTVREDYSADGDAWSYFPHEHARLRAYRWGEDGIAGVCDRFQVLAFSLAMWNHKDPILKERLFGLTGPQGNHGEDVKEVYYYLDNTPTHSYMKYLYKYPQNAYPYEQLIQENAKRTQNDREYELLDTGIFANDEYFDVFVEYAKITPDDLCARITIVNRANHEAEIDLIPQMVFRNAWVWDKQKAHKPEIALSDSSHKYCSIVCSDEDATVLPYLNFEYRLGKRYVYAESGAEILFTGNETNFEALNQGPNPNKYTKDAFHRYVIHNEKEAVNHMNKGTKAGFLYRNLKVPANDTVSIRLRISDHLLKDPLDDVDKWIVQRKEEADEFYHDLHPEYVTEEQKMIQRQALAGMLWSKQIYIFQVNRWLEGDDPDHPPPPERKKIRNAHWRHLVSKRIMSMPDKWEYPWFAAWDLAFQCVSLALVDMAFAKEQLWLLLFDQFQHPNGQIPAYEWEFSELNPPVQAWAVWRIYEIEYERTGTKDHSFLQKCFHKMMINFVWWVNRVDSQGNNVFEGGFLGLDNITVIDRSVKIPNGGRLEQSDGTGWMGLFCLKMMRISLELAKEDSDYESLAIKFAEHFLYIGAALERSDNRKAQNWNEDDGFFYDVLCYDNGEHKQIYVRSLVGIIPLFAVDFLSDEEIAQFKEFKQSFEWFLAHRQVVMEPCLTRVDRKDKKGYLISLVKPHRMRRILEKTWDPKEFRSNYGLRSLSKYHEEHPYELFNHTVFYDPGECRFKIKGGNSNWRGPIWFPITYLFIETLETVYDILGDDLKVRVDGEDEVDLKQMAHYFSKALVAIFEKKDGKRPVFGDYDKFSQDPNFSEYLFFHEHFHGENGRGLGASHQTGWTGLVANIIDEWLPKYNH